MSSRRRKRGSGGVGGILALGCVLLLGSVGLSAVLVCGGFGSALWSALPTVVEVDPPRNVPGTPAAPAPEPEPEPVRRPRPRRPRPSPSPSEQPAVVDVEPETLLVAQIAVEGDAELVVARSSDGTLRPLPGSLPRGPYDLVVTFPGRSSFEAGTLSVLDGTPRTVVCRAALGICKVR